MTKTNPIARTMSVEPRAKDDEAPLHPLGGVSKPQAARDYARLDRFMRADEVIFVTGLSCSTLYRKIGNGSFPRQVRLGANMVAWRESQVSGWIQNPT